MDSGGGAGRATGYFLPALRAELPARQSSAVKARVQEMRPDHFGLACFLFVEPSA